MRPVLPACFALLALVGGCDSSDERETTPGSRYKFVQNTVVSDTCLEDSPGFRNEQLEHLDLHLLPLGEGSPPTRTVNAFGPGGNADLRLRDWFNPASSPEGRWIPNDQRDAWPPTESWEDRDWAATSVSTVGDRTGELALLRPNHREARIMDLEGDFLHLEQVFDLYRCPTPQDCAPWGGPCTRHVRMVFEYDSDVPDFMDEWSANQD